MGSRKQLSFSKSADKTIKAFLQNVIKILSIIHNDSKNVKILNNHKIIQ